MIGLRRVAFWFLAASPIFAIPVSAQSTEATAPASAADNQAQLTRQQAIAEALAHNPGLIASREQVEQARAQVVVATALADPTIAADVAGQNHVLDPTSGNGTDIGVGFTIPFPGKTSLRRGVAVSALHVAELTLAQLQQQVASQAVDAYDAILVAKRHREDLQESKDLSDDFLKKTQARFLGGTVARLDVLKAEVDVAQAENALIANERATATARATLNRLLGRMGGAPLDATDDLAVPGSLATIDALEGLAESSRPEIRSVAVQIEGAQVASRLARQFWLPDIDLSLTRNAVDGTATTWTTAVGFGFPLFFWQHKAGDVAAARHRELELSANATDIRTQVSLDVQNAYAGASTALRQAIFIRDKLLPEAKQVYHVASVSYGLGGSSALDLLDAKRTLLDAESQFVDALGAANDAAAALELAVGAHLPPATANSGDQQ